MSKKPAIPTIPTNPLSPILNAIKSNIETMTGAVGRPLTKLPANASNEQIVAKINEIIARMNING